MYDKRSLRMRLADGERLIGTWVGMRSPAAIELLAQLPFDFIILDLQHGELSLEDILKVAPVFRFACADPVVRMLDHSPANIGRILDFGIENVIVPTVNTAADARVCVEASAYPPFGTRSFGPFRASQYGLHETPITPSLDRMIGVQIETAEAVHNLDAILAVPNLGLAFLGPYDLRISTGLPSFDALESTAKTIADGCRTHGVPFGTMAVTLEDAKRWLALGVQFLSVGVDLDILKSGAAALESSLSRFKTVRQPPAQAKKPS
jgi:4-hydroxy-2-oxoheptanedioate aldolase